MKIRVYDKYQRLLAAANRLNHAVVELQREIHRPTRAAQGVVMSATEFSPPPPTSVGAPHTEPFSLE